MTNKDLLNSTKNSVQSYVAAWMGEEFGEKGYMNSMIDSLCYLHLKLSRIINWLYSSRKEKV